MVIYFYSFIVAPRFIVLGILKYINKLTFNNGKWDEVEMRLKMDVCTILEYYKILKMSQNPTSFHFTVLEIDF